MTGISAQIWDMKYRLKDETGKPIDQTVEDTWRRVARALSQAENEDIREEWMQKFYKAQEDYKFLPAGRIIAGAGTGRDVTLFNCFVMGTIPDSMDGIFSHLREAALTMQQGGGIGYDFSPIRPKGALVKGVAADASGPLSFMDCWDSMCRTVMSAGSRRGAMMATMRCDHPDIEDFIEAKRDPNRLRMFNVSVLVTDAFMTAVEADEAWELIHEKPPQSGVQGTKIGVDGVKRYLWKTVRARDLWDKIMQATYDVAEPGVIFIDRINEKNNLRYCETISATNPCGEQPLPPYGACLLGSINLAKFVVDPYQPHAVLNADELKETVSVAIRAMDNVNDISGFPLDKQASEAQAKRRIGLGVTGLADALMMMGVRYGSKEAAALADQWIHTINNTAYETSAALAKEKGKFPLFANAYDPKTPLDWDTRRSVAYGMRNSHVTSIAPTGTISLYAENVSSGIEPIFAPSYTRKVLQPDGSRTEQEVVDYAVRLWRELGNEGLPPAYVDAQTITPEEHVRMQAAVQTHCDTSISKTVNLPEDISFEDFKDVYRLAYDSGCKGCTTYRPNDVTGSILSVEPKKVEKPAETLADRPDSVQGATYKLKWPDSPHALYVTVNDCEGRPYEVFINSKNPEHHTWTTALTRMVSAVFRRGGDVSFVVEELKAVFDPRGGAWMKGAYVPSIVAAIGGVIEEHMRAVGYIGEGVSFNEKSCPSPSCNIVVEGGCETCKDCGYSKCG